MNNTIFVNQIGYPCDGMKLAYVYEKDTDGKNSFELLKDGKSVFTGKISPAVKDDVAGDPVCCCDFSEFKQEGKYEIKIGNSKSCPVYVGKDLYKKLYYSSLNYFTLSRCGEDITDDENPLWNHEACHTSTAEIYGTKETKNVQGGWHDAGDYGRYVVAGTKTIMDLLLAYDESKDIYKDFDILKEVRFELEWLLQMQREDGGVYHKISCYHFCGFILPQKETDKIVISPVSTAATCDFAGCLAFASKYFEKSDKAFADKLLAAAIKAGEYADKTSDEIFSNPPEITTGSYGDWNVSDERYFALCSLFAATKDSSYLQKALELRKTQKSKTESYSEPWKRNWSEGFGWGSVGAYGTEILLKNADLISNKEIYEDLKNGIVSQADSLVEKSEKAAFGLSLAHIFWGSNGAVCDEAHMLLLANDLTGDKKYFTAAQKNFNYIVGCNPLNLCYVSGNGTNSPKKPHHRPSGFLNSVMPGMLSGGPSAGLQDDVARKNLQGKAPLLCFIDETGSYSTNEVAIYWNSPFVYTLAKLKLL